jgi:transcriptional regulator
MEAAPVLAIFQGPQHYITPSWYPSKQEHGKVVPTWNYHAVHVRGRAMLFEEQSLLVKHLHALTGQNEEPFEDPGSIEDAPPDYIGALSKAIVGLEFSSIPSKASGRRVRTVRKPIGAAWRQA